MNENSNCPLCDLGPIYLKRDFNRDALNVECDRCGRFTITEEALFVLKSDQKWRLSAFCRRAGTANVTILSTNIGQLIQSLPNYSPPEKLDNLLQLMGDMSPGLGEYTTFDRDRDYTLLVSPGTDEVNYLEQTLISRGYLDGTHDGFVLTMPAWEHLEAIRRQGKDSSRAFVAMWFHESMNETYERAIALAISEAGYDPLRIDRHEHVNRIDDEIIGQIRRSRFMVADFTGQRHGVYFEAGLMMGLGRQVIWMCRKAELDRDGGLHFDVRQFNFIAYESLEDAKTKLYNRILAIEGEGPVRGQI